MRFALLPKSSYTQLCQYENRCQTLSAIPIASAWHLSMQKIYFLTNGKYTATPVFLLTVTIVCAVTDPRPLLAVTIAV